MRKLDIAYQEISTKYATEPQNLEKDMKNLDEKLAEKRELLSKLSATAPESLINDTKKEIADLEVKTNNLHGYVKYKDQINSIQKVKGNIQKRIRADQKIRNQLETEVNQLRKDLLDINQKVSNEEYLKTLTNAEYEDLFKIKAEYERQLPIKERRLKELEAKIVRQSGEVNKCDLAWRTLFANKDWDAIQTRAISDQRFKRNIDEKHIPIQEVEKQLPTIKEASKLTKVAQAAKNVIGLEEIEEDEPEELKDYLPAKVTVWTRIKNFFRNIKDKMTGNSKEVETTEQPVKNVERDEFLEGLRRYADKDYSQGKTSEKENQTNIKQNADREL